MIDETPPSSELCQEVREKAATICATINRYKSRSIMPRVNIWYLIEHTISCGDCRNFLKTAPNYQGFLTAREASLLNHTLGL